MATIRVKPTMQLPARHRIMTRIFGRQRARQVTWILDELGVGATAAHTLAAAGRISLARVYRILEDLERCGQVSSRWSPGRYPRTRMYYLTEQGG